MKAYPFIKDKNEINIPVRETETQVLSELITTGEENYQVAEARNIVEVKQLLAKGYNFEMDFDGVKFFTKK